jgi:hypothetical protein
LWLFRIANQAIIPLTNKKACGSLIVLDNTSPAITIFLAQIHGIRLVLKENKTN